MRVAVCVGARQVLGDGCATQATALGWLGGGLIVLAGGLWIAFTHFTASPPKPPSVSADRGSFATGGDVSTGGGAITLGAQPAPLADKTSTNDKAGARP
jgi:hypothetical protein